jgi:hypothetical protein
LIQLSPIWLLTPAGKRASTTVQEHSRSNSGTHSARVLSGLFLVAKVALNACQSASDSHRSVTDKFCVFSWRVCSR